MGKQLLQCLILELQSRETYDSLVLQCAGGGETQPSWSGQLRKTSICTTFSQRLVGRANHPSKLMIQVLLRIYWRRPVVV